MGPLLDLKLNAKIIPRPNFCLISYHDSEKEMSSVYYHVLLQRAVIVFFNIIDVSYDATSFDDSYYFCLKVGLVSAFANLI